MSIERDLEGWTIAFDLDGTLVDSAPDLVGTLNRMLVSQGLPTVPAEGAQKLIGGGARALLAHGFEAVGADPERARDPALFEAFIADYIDHIADESVPFEGAHETLENLSQRGARLVVVTNKLTNLSEMLLGKLEMTHHFAAIVGADKVSAKKPSAAHLLEAVKLVEGDEKRVIMVGDASPDIGTARDAGLPIIGVTFGYTPVPMEELEPDVIVDAFEDIEEAVDMIVVEHYVNMAVNF